ncbi:hypothetical protein [Devosia sp. 66-22]|uniref:hypothetical protein n=1 Tax=Devosia sp. 66-22 TaxID=1895753 RepID=UPI00092C7667|nr:hypothetical protein [Devosia sp. 66-22]OJX53640.1 MAG: hypothetical protein BGO81_13820 [Devosia sp. 66-22]
MNPESELLILVGRMEGKLDGFLAIQSEQGKRIHGLDDRLGAVETDVATLKASRSTNLNWLTIGVSVLGTLIAGLALYFGAT